MLKTISSRDDEPALISRVCFPGYCSSIFTSVEFVFEAVCCTTRSTLHTTLKPVWCGHLFLCNPSSHFPW